MAMTAIAISMATTMKFLYQWQQPRALLHDYLDTNQLFL